MERFLVSSPQVYATSIWYEIGYLLLIEDSKKTKKLLLDFHLFFIMC